MPALTSRDKELACLGWNFFFALKQGVLLFFPNLLIFWKFPNLTSHFLNPILFFYAPISFLFL